MKIHEHDKPVTFSGRVSRGVDMSLPAEVTCPEKRPLNNPKSPKSDTLLFMLSKVHDLICLHHVGRILPVDMAAKAKPDALAGSAARDEATRPSEKE